MWQKFRYSSRWLMLLMGIALLWTCSVGQSEEYHSQSAQTGEDRLLVLSGGKILRGKISPVAGGYAVDLPSGRIAVPYENIICEAATLREAYRKQRDAIRTPSADQHIQLANWCIQQKLYEEAEAELNEALKLQPQHHVARRLIQQLGHRKPQEKDFTENDQKKQMESLLVKQEFSTARPIGDLSPPLAHAFSSRIEPLLINSCANSSCHAETSGNQFRLQHKWNSRGNTRHITDQNLEAVIQQIDFTDPANSPLLTALNGQHGPRKTDVFAGTRAKEHRLVLQQWTMQVAKFSGSPAAQPSGNLIQQAMHQQEPESPLKPAELQTVSGQMVPTPLPLHVNGQEKAIDSGIDRVDEIRREQAFDPFDPAVFNRRKHGRE